MPPRAPRGLNTVVQREPSDTALTTLRCWRTPLHPRQFALCLPPPAAFRFSVIGQDVAPAGPHFDNSHRNYTTRCCQHTCQRGEVPVREETPVKTKANHHGHYVPGNEPSDAARRAPTPRADPVAGLFVCFAH
jgi:hypothetical protein